MRPLSLSDYDEVYALWDNTEGMCLGASDTRPSIEAYLLRNPGLSRVALDKNLRIIGGVLCGHDGRRGYLHHLAVAVNHRKQGIGRALVQACTQDLRALGIPKCNLFLFGDNALGREFWLHEGWEPREDLVVIQKAL